MPYIGNAGHDAQRVLVLRAPAPSQSGSGQRKQLAARRAPAGAGGYKRVARRSLGSYNDARAADYAGDDLQGFFKNLARAVKKVASPVQKGLTAVGHAAGGAITSKIGQGILGTALAVTGVGAVPAALIFGGAKAGGNLIKKGGNLKHAATGFAQGAVEGVASNVAGRAVRGAKNAITRLAKRGASAVVGKTAGGAAAVADSPAIIDDILNRGVPAIADPIPSDAGGESAAPFLPQVQAAPLPVDTSAQQIAAQQARIDAANQAAAAAAQAAAQAQAQAQAQIDAANQAAADAQAQGSQAAQQAAQDAADAAAQAQAQAQAQVDAANQAAQAAAEAQAQQLAVRRSTSSAGTDDSSPSDTNTSTDNGDVGDLEPPGDVGMSSGKKLLLAAGVIAGAGAVVAVARKKRKQRGR